MTSMRPWAAGLAVAVLALTGCEREAPAEQPVTPAPAASPAPAPGATVLALAERDPDFTTLVSALQAAGMAEMLGGDGPFTVFAPTNAAFEKVPAARRDFLTTPEGLPELRRLLSYHVVPGRLDASSLVQRIEAGGGSLALTTVNGGVLTARVGADGTVMLTDAAGGTSRVVEADIIAANGAVHAVDTVAEPG
ncbi:MAG: fasciclin domain-containing protein [Brevundimonas sp.]|nr:fasciclin domain-containing protein [Brevundimonas sp.]